MGYQESLIRVSSLAEIAGIEKAIAESEEVQTLEYLVCICGAKAKVDLYRDNTFTASRPLSDIKPNEEPIIRAGDLLPSSRVQDCINLFSGSTASQESPIQDTRSSWKTFHLMSHGKRQSSIQTKQKGRNVHEKKPEPKLYPCHARRTPHPASRRIHQPTCSKTGNPNGPLVKTGCLTVLTACILSTNLYTKKRPLWSSLQSTPLSLLRARCSEKSGSIDRRRYGR